MAIDGNCVLLWAILGTAKAGCVRKYDATEVLQPLTSFKHGTRTRGGWCFRSSFPLRDSALSRLRVPVSPRLRALALQDNVELRSSKKLRAAGGSRLQVALPEMPTLVKQAGCMQPLRNAEDLAQKLT